MVDDGGSAGHGQVTSIDRLFLGSFNTQVHKILISLFRVGQNYKIMMACALYTAHES